MVEPFQRLIEEGQLLAYRYDGFWRAMDTLKDKQILEDMVERGDMPWQPQGRKQAGGGAPNEGPCSWREPGERLSVLCLGAHSDDIEIGAGATILQLAWRRGVRLDVHLVRAVGRPGAREAEARASAADFLRRRRARPHRDPAASATASFPRERATIKAWFEAAARGASSPTSSSRTAATTRTRIIARSAGSPGTRSATT